MKFPALICFYVFLAVVLAKKKKLKTSISGRKESDQCFQSGMTWSTKHRIRNFWNIKSRNKCLKKCADENICKGFTLYTDENKGGRKIRDVCVLFYDTIDVQNCKDCVSGEMNSCLCRYGKIVKNCTENVINLTRSKITVIGI